LPKVLFGLTVVLSLRGMRAALIFGDESDTSRPGERDVFVYAFLGMRHSTYEVLQESFWQRKRALRVAGEVKWGRIGPQRAPFLALLAEHPVEVAYFVADKSKRPRSRPDRYRFKTIETAFSSLFPLSIESMPLVLLDERHEHQNREEALVLRALSRKWQASIPPYAYLPSDRVVGLQLVDLVVGALRAFESREDTTWEILKGFTRRLEI
jgi:hypothetical protein